MNPALTITRLALSALADLLFPPDDMTHSNYSAVVDITLYVHGYSLPVSHVGGRRLMVMELPTPIEPCDAVLVATIDGREARKDVRLVKGIERVGEWARFRDAV